ncbi:MAG: serine hydrolase [Proteobacteria bacterium]|nr:serine hydrolase [Pseudomonadota bacterium]
MLALEATLPNITAHTLIAGLIAQADDAPGLALAVVRDGRLVAQHCVGLANLEHRVPIRPDTGFHIVSMSKTFDAAAVLTLAATGALSLDDDIRRHLPELPAAISKTGAVKICNLLSMTSGLRDTLEIERLRGRWGVDRSSVGDLLAIAYRQSEVSAPVGTEYMYANINFVLLREIIRRVTGMPTDEYRRRVLYEPLGMTATCERAHDGIVLAGLAAPYVPDGTAWVRATDLLGIAGDPLVTNLEDLTRWILAIRDGRLGGTATTPLMAERTRLNDGNCVYYGLGLAHRRYRGLQVLCHSGSQPGYKAHIAYLPERDLGVAVLSNREDAAPAALACSVIEACLGDDFPASHPEHGAAERLASTNLPRDPFPAIEGTYVDAETGEWLTLALRNGVLHAETLGDPLFLYHAGNGVFRDGEDYRATLPAELSFEFAAGPETTICRANLGGRRSRLIKQPPRTLDGQALRAFAGRYESEEIASRHEVSLGADGLVIQYGIGFETGRSFAMTSIAPDIFLVQPTAPGIAYRHVFGFERNAGGRIIAATVTMDRLRGVRLERIA